MRLNILGGTLMVFLVSACASVPRSETAVASTQKPAPAPAAGGPLAMNTARLQINVQGGSYSELETKSEKEQSFMLVLERVNKDPTWLAAQSLCVKGAIPGKMACLKVSQSGLDSSLLHMRVGIGIDGKGSPQTTELEGEFALGEEILVKITITPRELEFAVNGRPMFAQTVDFATDKIRLGCSSGECLFKLL